MRQANWKTRNKGREFVGNELIHYLEHIILSRWNEDAGNVAISEKYSTGLPHKTVKIIN